MVMLQLYKHWVPVVIVERFMSWAQHGSRAGSGPGGGTDEVEDHAPLWMLDRTSCNVLYDLTFSTLRCRVC